MTHPSFDPPYPLEGLTPKIRAVTKYIELANQSPLPMCATSVLAGCTLAAQGLIKVQWRNAPASPVGMIFVVEAHSGERKTANDQIALEEHRFFDKGQSQLEAEDAKQHALKETIWKAKKKSMIRDIEKNGLKGNDTTAIEKLLEIHELNRPCCPKRPRMLISNITAPAISWHLSEKYPYAGLVSDEGGVILSSGALSNPAMINSIWDDGSAITDRMSRGRTELYDASLTVYLQVQPGVFEHFLQRRGNLAHASGNSSRWLYANPQSNQGTRTRKNTDLPTNDKDVYNTRIGDMLSRYVSIDIPKPKIKTLTTAAERELIDFSESIERELADGGRFVFMRGAAAKAAENCARLAAVMHEFDYSSEEIDCETMKGAIKVIAWHLNQYRMRFCPRTQMEVDIQDLEECITNNYHRWQKEGEVKGYELLKYAPYRLRQIDKLLNVALELSLQEKGTIWGQETRGWRFQLTNWLPSDQSFRIHQGLRNNPNDDPQKELKLERQKIAREAERRGAFGQSYELWPGCFLT